MKGTYREAELAVGLAEACGPRPAPFCSWWQRRPVHKQLSNPILPSCRSPTRNSRLVFTDEEALRKYRSARMTRYRKLSGNQLTRSTRIRFVRCFVGVIIGARSFH